MERTKRTAMVTGGSRGIGAAAVRLLAREGWQVAVGCCQNLARAQALCKELTAAGAEMVLSRPLGYWQEGLTALAGPGVNLLLALLFCAWPGGTVFAGLNLVLACFNMLPVGRLDGGRALYCTLALLAGPGWAGRVGRSMDLAGAALLLAGGVLSLGAGGNITLLLVALWLLAALFSQNNWGRNRNRACHRGGKQVK